MLTAFGYWLHGTALGQAAGGAIPWLGPACLALHFIGLMLLVGGIGVFDLRLLGMAKALPVAPLAGLLAWAAAGFLINATTGFILFAGNPFQYIDNAAFWLKMLFLVLAGVNVAVYYASGLARRVRLVGSGEDAPVAARISAGLSLVLWIAVMYWGRMILFIGDFF